MAKIIIIDGNSLLFRAFFATYAINPNNVMRNKDGIPTNAIFAFSNMIASLMNTMKKNDGIFVAFDAGKHTFRHQEYEGYKANRPPLPEELIVQFPIAREFLDALGIKHYECDELEADDIAGILAKKSEKEGYDVDIYTSDKDYLQLINDKITIQLIKKGLKDIKVMTPDSFREEWGFDPIKITDYKGLRGDDSDNLKGIPKVGDKTAKELIIKFGDLENIIANADTKSKVGQNIIEFQDSGRMCKHLAIIPTDKEIPLNPEDIIYKGYNFKQISDFSNKYDFKYLIPKLPKRLVLEDKKSKKVEFSEVFDTNSINFNDELSLDVDMEDGNYHYSNLTGLAFRVNDSTYYISLENLKKDEKLLSILGDKNVKKFAFDFKKVRTALLNNDIKVEGLYFDLLLANYLIDSNSKNSLEDVLLSYSVDTSYARNNDNLLFTNTNQIFSTLGAYYSRELFDEVIENLKEKNQYDLLMNIEQPLTIVLSDMEFEGFPLNTEKLLEFKGKYQQKIDQLTQEIYQLAGEEFNINSPKQVATILYDKLNLKGNKKGSTSVDYLASIENSHPIVSKILEYRKYTKLVSTYIDGFIPYVDKKGFIHPTFNQALTTTGRLSCSEPNLQNITTRDNESKEIRQAFFYDDPSLNILSLDYSQVELRVLAHLSNSKTLINVFNNGGDIHSATAKLVFNLDREPTSQERRKAKAVNFGIVYGISDWGLSDQLEIPVYEAKDIIHNFFRVFPEVKSYLDELVLKAQDSGYAETLFNRRRYLPDINSAQFQLREFAKRASMNAPIQGSAADIIKIAMIEVHKALKERGFKAKLVSQIHDELIIKVDDSEKDEVYKLVKDIMENCVKLNVMLEADGGYAKTWFDAK